ncbi:DUF4214 domain-containing protein [Pseudomonas umsongensis]
MSEQGEGLAKYPVALTNTDFITQIYQATLGRSPDAEGLAYWQDQLTNNSVGRDVFLAAVINGAKANSSAQGVLDAATLSNKATAGVAFADKGLNDLTLAGQVVASVNSNPDTLAAAQALIKLVPATAAGVTPALITMLSKTFDSIINLNAKAPGELSDLATYLTAVANQTSGTTDLSTLLTSVSNTVTKAATDSAALDNPASLAGDAVAAATPSTGGGNVSVPPTFTVTNNDESTLSFGGTATGDITFTVAADGTATFVRGGIIATTKPNVNDIVSAGGNTIKLSADATGLSVEMAAKLLAIIGFNANDKTYFLNDNLDALAGEGGTLVDDATGYTLTDAANTITTLNAAQAEVLEAADNAADYSYSLSVALADVPADLAVAGFTHATGYTLTDAANTITTLNAAQAEVLEAADNAADYSYSLSVALADVPADMSAYSHATGYALTDVANTITTLNVTQATVLEAATNAADYSYSLSVALADVPADMSAYSHATGYALTDVVNTITTLSAAQAEVLEAADNAADYSYSLSVALADVPADLAVAGFTHATGYTLTDAANTITTLNAAQAEVLEAADNAADYSYSLSVALADVPADLAVAGFTHATGYTLTDAANTITTLNAAQAEVLEAADNAADYSYSLSVALADVPADMSAYSHATGYALTDVANTITTLNVTQATVLEAATNAANYSYSLSVALADVPADMSAYSHATGYALTDVVNTITTLSAAQAEVLEAADNAADYSYSLSVALADVPADLAVAGFTHATGYTLTDAANTITTLSAAQAEVLEAADNAADYSYSLSVALADVPADLAVAGFTHATGYTLTDAANTITTLNAAQAEVLEAADNAADYSYSLSVALADVPADLAVAGFTHATGYTLTDAANTITTLNAAQAEVLEAADNAADYSYSLSVALADVPADMSAYSHATGYALTDVANTITTLNVTQATVLEAATNAADYSYSLSVALADVPADMSAYSHATGYALTDVVNTITTLSAAQAEVLEAADNAADYSYSLSVALADVPADLAVAGFTHATGYTLTDAANTITTLNAAQAEVLEAADNAADYSYSLSVALADVPADLAVAGFTHATGYTLTDAANTITTLNAAQAEVLEAADNAADYSYSLSVALADVPADLAVAGFTHATGYTLTDAANTITTLNAAQAEVLEAADNAADYSYSLSVALADVPADMSAYSHATGYALTDVANTITTLNVTQATVLEAATNAADYSYSLSVALADVPADMSAYSHATGYALTDVVNTITTLSAAQAEVLEAADNAADYSYSLSVALADVPADLAVAGFTHATGYTLTDAANTITTLNAAQAEVLEAADNAADYSYSLSVALADVPADLAVAGFTHATGYTLTDAANTITTLNAAQAEVLEAADNAADYSYSLSVALADAPADLAVAGFTHATGYTLTDAANTITTLNVTQATILEAATNAADYSYSLSVALADVPADMSAYSHATGYALTDVANTITTLNVTQATVLEAATNAADYSYSLSVALADVPADLAVAGFIHATGYTLTDAANTITTLNVTQATVLEAATNAADYSYSLSVALADVPADLAVAGFIHATGYTQTDAANTITTLNVTQATVLEAATNAADYSYSLSVALADVPADLAVAGFTHATGYTLTDVANTITTLNAAQAEVLEAADNAADYSYSLSVALADVPADLAVAGFTHATGFTLTDAANTITTLNVTQAEVLEAATNAADYSYSVLDTAANLVANHSYANATAYKLSADAADLSVTDATTLVGISSLNLNNHTFTIKDSIDHASGLNFTTGFAGNAGVYLTGAAGNQTVTGSAHNDIITGGAGADTLTGGAGADQFNFVAGDSGSYVFEKGYQTGLVDLGDTFTGNFDVITDFKTNDNDKLHIDGLNLASAGYINGLNTVFADPNKGGAFFVKGNYDTTTHAFSVNTSGMSTLVIYDANGTNEAIVLTGVTTSAPTDFV